MSAGIDLIRATVSPVAQKAAFLEIAAAMMATKNFSEAVARLQHSRSGHVQNLVEKASALTLSSDIWGPAGAQALAQSFIASHAPGNLFDAIQLYSFPLPTPLQPVLAAVGFSGNIIGEGSPKVVKTLQLRDSLPEIHKAVALLVLSEELVRATGEAGLRLIDREGGSAVNRAVNADVIAELVSSSSATATGSGTAVGDLKAGLGAAEASVGYVIGASHAAVAELALSEVNRSGMGIAGGELVPGIHVVPLDGVTSMYVIPASRLATADLGLQIKGAGHASVNMSDTPSGTGSQVSLWQTNSWGLKFERYFAIALNGVDVVVVPES